MSDQSLVRPGNTVTGGDMIALVSTGLGQTTPALKTGEYAGSANSTATATVTIGGRAANVQRSIALPGTAGLYWTVVQVPAGLPAGNQPVVLTIGGVATNSSNLAVR
jgi:uncharacterized protein (TIGR03437 family)